GIQILYDLKFVADSPELLQTEFTKIKNLANSLKKINEDNSFTILVEGHTADVNKPEGQMKLSIQRTQTIIKELVANGLDESIFTYRGYGGTQPIASNDTAEGRAQNRRVIITAQPKATYIQRK
ncbi:MAG: OmpA family protein, partial [Treponema sp.]|nr:OmpA family protein [Treponema sp.]